MSENFIGCGQVDLSGNCMGVAVNLSSSLPYLMTLDLSYNWIRASGIGNFSSMPSSLVALDLSKNQIGCRDYFSDGGCIEGAAVNFSGLPSSLVTLDLSWNSIGYDGAPANFSGLPSKLVTLDLSHNYIGYNDDAIIFSGLPSGLVTLDLSQNSIGYDGAPANFSGLPSRLVTLDLSKNVLGWSNGAAVNFNGLPSSLVTLDLSENAIGTSVNFSGLPISLVTLNLSSNYIGVSTESTFSLSQILSTMDHLRFLNLSSNNIGFTGPEGPIALFNALESLPHFDFDNLIGLNQITNVSWGNGSTASILQKARFSSLINACQHSMCHGGSISNTPSGSSFRSMVPPEPATLLPPSSSFAELPSNTTMPHDSRALVVYEEPLPQPSVLGDLGTSMVTGAALAVLPEVIGDSLYLSGRMSEQNVSRLKLATNAALVMATGSWMGVGASWLTTKGLQYVGVAEPTARIAGNTTAFLVNSARNFTPLGLTATALHYGAGYLGLLGEKKAMRWMFNKG